MNSFDERLSQLVPTEEARPWPELDEAAFHGLAGEVVCNIEPHTEADPAALLIDFLVSFGCLLGPGPHAVAEGSQHPARLFAVVVGNTSRARKGSSRSQIRRIFEVVDETWTRKRVPSGLASGEGLISAVADVEKGKAPDKRLLVVEEEFARALAVASRDGSTLSPIMRQAWDIGRLQVLTKREPLVASGAHICVLGHITLEELTRRLTETDVANGFANRFLFVCAKRSKLLPDGGALTERDIGRLGRLVRTALEEGRKRSVLQRSKEAADLWARMYGRVAEHAPGGLLGAVTARAEAQLLRLSVVYALMDGSGAIEPQHLRAAWAVWSYAEASAAFVFGDAEGDEIADRLLAAVKRAGDEGMDGTAQRDLFGRHVTGARLEAARRLLESRGKVRNIKEETGGRPRVVTFFVGGDVATKATKDILREGSSEKPPPSSAVATEATEATQLNGTTPRESQAAPRPDDPAAKVPTR